MSNKLIFILVDALGYDTATRYCGFLEHLVEAKRGAKYRLQGGLPAISRPMYESLLTGVPVWQHLITSNDTRRHSRCENLFSLTKQAGLVNACAGYNWLRELYGECEGNRFSIFRDRYALEGTGDIMHGIFYAADEYPDSHLFADAEFLRTRYNPDFLMIHPMATDNNGHQSGAGSAPYCGSAGDASDIIAQLWEGWMKDGYQVVITGDHGMDALGIHAGNDPIQRQTPLYIFSDRALPGDYSDEIPVTTLDVAPLMCRLLGISPSDAMTDTDILIK